MKWIWHLSYKNAAKMYPHDVTISKLWNQISYSEPVCKEMVEEIMLDLTIPEDIKTDAMRRLMELQDV